MGILRIESRKTWGVTDKHLRSMQEINMSSTRGFMIMVLAIVLFQVAESYVLERENLEKRAYSDPEDPRNLFAAMYGGVYKRARDDSLMADMAPAERLHLLKNIMHKRGLRDPDDPRNLFHSVYGGIWK